MPPEFMVPDALKLADEAATIAAGQRIAASLQRGDVLLLEGDLGAGKSTLARAIIRTLDPAVSEVPSPTFTLVQTYPVTGAIIWHFDLWRLANWPEIEELGWDEAMAGGIILVEWPDRLGPLCPPGAARLTLSNHGRGRALRIAPADENSAPELARRLYKAAASGQ